MVKAIDLDKALRSLIPSTAASDKKTIGDFEYVRRQDDHEETVKEADNLLYEFREKIYQQDHLSEKIGWLTDSLTQVIDTIPYKIVVGAVRNTLIKEWLSDNVEDWEIIDVVEGWLVIFKTNDDLTLFKINFGIL